MSRYTTDELDNTPRSDSGSQFLIQTPKARGQRTTRRTRSPKPFRTTDSAQVDVGTDHYIPFHFDESLPEEPFAQFIERESNTQRRERVPSPVSFKEVPHFQLPDPPRSHRNPPINVEAVEKSTGSAPTWKDTAHVACLSTLSYFFDVLRLAFGFLRKPLSLILVGSILFVLVQHTIYSTISPMCSLPVVSQLPICRTFAELVPRSRPKSAPYIEADYPKLIDIQSFTFEKLLDDSVGGAELALEIKKAEMATSDLNTLVKASTLMSRDRISEALKTFIADARKTSRGLQQFSAKVNGAVDVIMAINDYSLAQIEAAGSESASPSLWKRTVSVLPSWPWSPMSILATTFTQSMAVLEYELRMLIMAAEASFHDLDALEEQLRLLHVIVSREDQSLSSSKQELLSSLWTLVGGNKATLRVQDSHLALLSSLTDYRQRALAHVVGALHTLETMSAELEELRTRVAQPGLLGENIPTEVHVRSIRSGLKRLTESRMKTKTVQGSSYAKLTGPLV